MRTWLVALAVALLPAAAAGQEASGGVFSSGPLTWSPSLALRDFGWDSNVFSEPVAPTSDFTATLVPAAELSLNTAHLKISGASTFDLIYYEKVTSYRAFNRRFNGRVEVPLKAFVPFLAGAYQRAKDRQGLEITTPERHHERDVSTGANLLFGTRAVIQMTLRKQDQVYDPNQVVRGADLATNLNRSDRSATAALRFTLTSLTSLIGDASVSRAAYEFKPERDQDNARAGLALEFAPDAIVRGRAGFGYHRLHAVDPATISYQGMTFDVDLSYILLGSTRFDGRYSRDTAASIEAPYYLQTAYGLDVLQTFIGPTELIGRINRQQADYPGSESKNLKPRLDITDTYGGGLAIRMGKGSRMTFNYEFSHRRSIFDLLTYDRQRVFTSVLLGF